MLDYGNTSYFVSYTNGMIKAIIFDCFGVIIADALQLTCDRLRAKDPAAADEIGDIVQATNRGMIDTQTSRIKIAALLGQTLDEHRALIIDGEVKDAQLLTYILDLRKNYKTAMLSNIGKGSLGQRFTQEELAIHFDTVVVSGDIGYAKPEPEAYEITADRLGVRLDECLFTDDREVFCEAAKAVGMQAIQYQNFKQFKEELHQVLHL